MKHTLFENVISFLIGLLIAVPICIAAIISRIDSQMERLANQKQPTRYIYQTREVEVEVPVPVIVHDTVYISQGGVAYDTEFTQAEIDLMVSLVHYEAGNQDEIGKRLVVDTVLNRLDNDRFPNKIEEVIYQRSDGVYQYTVAGIGALNNGVAYCTEEEFRIVEEEILNRLDKDVIFFQRDNYSKSGKPLYQHGDHYFSGLKEA